MGKRTRSRQRSFGYNCSYQNMKCDELCKKDNLLICALDKHYYPYLTQFPPNTKLVIHDPTEYKTGSEFDISRFEVITIRSKVQEYLPKGHTICSTQSSIFQISTLNPRQSRL